MKDNLFQEKLSIANKTEREVANLLSVRGASNFEFCNDSRWDIKCEKDDEIITLEVKEDFQCQQYNNIAVEFSSRDKPSGIEVTKAEYFVYVIHTKSGIKYLLFKTDKLKKMISDKRYSRIASGKDTDGNFNKFYLFPYEKFCTLGKFIQ